MKLEEMEALCAAATPGPWRPDIAQMGDDGCDGSAAVAPIHSYEDYDDTDQYAAYELAEHAAQNDADFIAAARTLLPKMINALKEAKTMRFYCLGSDCSTKNMLERFDKAINELEQP